MRVDRGDEFVDAGAVGRDGSHDRRGPRLGRTIGVRQHRLQVAHGVGGTVAISLVDDEDVRNLQDAGFRRLHGVAHAGRDQHDRAVRQRCDVDFRLPYPDGLDQHDVEAGGVEYANRLRGRTGQAAEMAARRHRPDVHAVVAGMALHAHPVAEQRAPEKGDDGSMARTPTRQPALR
jgi:hypothetical protein